MNDKEFLYKVGKYGFFQSLQAIYMAKEYAKELGMNNLIVDSSSFAYSFDKGIKDYYTIDDDYIKLLELDITKRKTRVDLKNLGSLHHITSDLTAELIKFKDYLNKIKFSYLVTKFNLDKLIEWNLDFNNLVSIHYRGQDKHLESKRLSAKDYKLSSNFDYYISTDDPNCIDDFNNTYPNIKFYYNQDNFNYIRTGDKFVYSDLDLRKMHTLNMLLDVYVCSNSKIHIGDSSSLVDIFLFNYRKNTTYDVRSDDIRLKFLKLRFNCVDGVSLPSDYPKMITDNILNQ